VAGGSASAAGVDEAKERFQEIQGAYSGNQSINQLLLAAPIDRSHHELIHDRFNISPPSPSSCCSC
jgi:hypothetical protein